ncbi:helix-turn-helix domain-containing protein [Dactylosporangium matsuzakiense]|uniref:helix-turn-helix domain-containing protein n=1 Tax=Dactylosporangium matsuzakiense TaxID=53360 RepID=UPI0034D986E9
MAVDASSELAQRLTSLKEATGCSYTELAGRAALSRSTVHRYCSGAAVPPDFDTVSRLARACGADRGELLDLHRMWVLAAARPATGKPAEPAPPPEPGATCRPAAGTAPPAPPPPGPGRRRDLRAVRPHRAQRVRRLRRPAVRPRGRRGRAEGRGLRLGDRPGRAR